MFFRSITVRGLCPCRVPHCAGIDIELSQVFHLSVLVRKSKLLLRKRLLLNRKSGNSLASLGGCCTTYRNVQDSKQHRSVFRWSGDIFRRNAVRFSGAKRTFRHRKSAFLRTFRSKAERDIGNLIPDFCYRILAFGTRPVIPSTRAPSERNKGGLIHCCFKGQSMAVCNRKAAKAPDPK